jgi:hypothetical protein
MPKRRFTDALNTCTWTWKYAVAKPHYTTKNQSERELIRSLVAVMLEGAWNIGLERLVRDDLFRAAWNLVDLEPSRFEPQFVIDLINKTDDLNPQWTMLVNLTMLQIPALKLIAFENIVHGSVDRDDLLVRDAVLKGILFEPPLYSVPKSMRVQVARSVNEASYQFGSNRFKT